MRKRRIAAFALSVAGILFVAAELMLGVLGKRLCASEGCLVVARHTRFGETSILVLGLAVFILLSLLLFLSVIRGMKQMDWYCTILINVALASEGFFAGYQAFAVQTACYSCLTVFGLFLAVGGLWFLSGERGILTGFGSLAAVFSLFFLILPAGGAPALPADEMVLFYSEDCKYCRLVMQSMEEKGVPAVHLPVARYSGLLKEMGIEHVPTLLVNRPTDKIFLTGKDAIDRYLAARAGSEEKPRVAEGRKTSAVRAQSRKDPEKVGSQKGNPGEVLSSEKGAELPPLNSLDLLLQGGGQGDGGMCKETVKCD